MRNACGVGTSFKNQPECIFCWLDEDRYGGRPKKKRSLSPTRPEALKSNEEELDHASREIVSDMAMYVAADHVSQQKDGQVTPLEEQQPLCKMLSSEVSPNDNAKPGTDCTLAELLHSATPDYRPSEASVLSIDRMLHPFSDLLCAVCQLLINQAVETPCCHQLFCAVYIFEWLGLSAVCPTCRDDLFTSSLLPAHPRVSGILAQVPVTCDYASTDRLGCQLVLQLRDFRQHVNENCKFRPTSACHSPLRKVITHSSQVDDVLTASPSKLQGNVAERLIAHLVAAQETNGKFEVKTAESCKPGYE